MKYERACDAIPRSAAGFGYAVPYGEGFRGIGTGPVAVVAEAGRGSHVALVLRRPHPDGGLEGRSLPRID
ncbi:MAG: hypothetical protein QGI83_06970 [Candidatus Latescibacteria bacterium]|jgi:hypothetical protein|nr:hypothetical protein [Candidatus Latescibacterota bacterium]